MQNAHAEAILEVQRLADHPSFDYEIGVTNRLTCQGAEWEPVLKYGAMRIALLPPRYES